MRISGVNFQTWCRNHARDHDARWCRQLYPWRAFAAIDYGKNNIDTEQIVESGGIKYTAILRAVYIGDNSRLNFLIDLTTGARSNTARWKNIPWNSRFHLVATIDGNFITLFTEKRDPAKSLLGSFMAADFANIEAHRCLQYSNLLFRSIVSYRAEELFGVQDNSAPFLWNPSGARKLDPHPQFRNSVRQIPLYPLWADGRRLWVTAQWTEEKAHRFALYNANQCMELIVVYCHPTFSRHHRCVYEGTKVVSLLSFVSGSPDRRRSLFHRQARFLINNLQIQEIKNKKTTKGSRTITDEIIALRNTKKLEIPVSLLREAKSGLEFEITSVGDAAYFFSCANLINAALTGQYGVGSIPTSLSKGVHSFKARVSHVAESLIQNPIEGIEIYFDQHLMYVKIDRIQFSFHAIAHSETIRRFIRSAENKQQDWSGIRLQRISPIVLDWGRAMLLEHQ